MDNLHRSKEKKRDISETIELTEYDEQNTEEQQISQNPYIDNINFMLEGMGMLRENQEDFLERAEKLQESSMSEAVPVAILDSHPTAHAEVPQKHRKGRMQRKNERKEEKRTMEESAKERLILRYQENLASKRKPPKAIAYEDEAAVREAVFSVKNVDIDVLQSLSEEELISEETQQRLFSLRAEAERAVDAVEINGGMPIIEEVYQKPDFDPNLNDPAQTIPKNIWYRDLAVHKAKTKIIRAISDKARWLAIRDAHRQGRQYVSELALTKTEQKLLKKNSLDALVNAKLAEADAQIRAAKTAAISDTAFRDSYTMGLNMGGSSRVEPSPQTRYVSDLWARNAAFRLERLGKNCDSFEDKKNLYLELSASEREEDRILAQELEFQQALKSRHYILAGDDDQLIPEPLFRGSPVIADFAVYREKMSIEDQIEMMKKLSAGAFLQKGVDSDEKIADAREQNIQGLRQYYDLVSDCYEYLYDKYGTEPMDPLYFISHKEEINRDFMCVQVIGNMCAHDRTVLDPEHSEKDARIMNLGLFYNSFRYVLENVFFDIGNRDLTTRERVPISYESLIARQKNILEGREQSNIWPDISQQRQFLMANHI